MSTLTAPLNSLEAPELGTLSPAMQTLYAPVAAADPRRKPRRLTPRGAAKVLSAMRLLPSWFMLNDVAVRPVLVVKSLPPPPRSWRANPPGWRR